MPQASTYWTGKHALVTGATSGLGLAITRALLDAGANVALIARDEARLQATIAGFQLAPARTLALAADITNQADVDRIAAQLNSRWGKLDLLVNCAGRSGRGRIEDTTPEQFQAFWELNFLAAIRCTRACLPLLLQSRGHVVQIGSLASKIASKYLGAYPAGKFALAAYSQQLRMELGDQGLHVLLVCPGPIARADAGQRYAAEAANLPAEAQQPGGGAKLKGIEPDVLAKKILHACQRRQPELIVPAKARLLFTLAALWPSLGDWLTKRMTGG